MSVWLVRAGKSGERENYALEHGAVVIGWPGMGDMTSIATREEMLARMQEAHAGAKLNTVRNWTSQVWPFVKEIKAGDTIALPLKGRPAVMFGKAKGGYRYVPDAPVEAKNQIPVEWVREVPRGAIPQDVLYSLGAFMTVCRIWRNDAETRIAALLDGKAVAVPSPADMGTTEEGAETIDLEETSRNAISAAIYARYKGHGLERLVAAVLEAQGYKTRVSPEGADGGVDVVAGSGPLGFDAPRLVVQVKSEQGAVDVKVVRELHGVMRDFGADHGLLVAWGGRLQEQRHEGDRTQVLRGATLDRGRSGAGRARALRPPSGGHPGGTAAQTHLDARARVRVVPTLFIPGHSCCDSGLAVGTCPSCL